MSTRDRTTGSELGGRGALGAIAAAIVAFAVSKGVALDQIESATAISGDDLVDPNARLPDDVMPKIWHLLGAHAGHESALPIEMARAAPFSILGGLAHSAQFAENLRAALDLLVKNKVILADRLHLELIEDETVAALVASHPSDVLDNGRTLTMGLGIVARLISEILSVDNKLTRVEFSHTPSGPQDAYSAFFQAPVLFSQSRSALVFNRSQLDIRVNQANIELFSYVQVHFDQVRRRLERTRYPPKLAKLYTAVMDNAELADYTAASAASRANLSLRAAQRLAENHGTSLQNLIQQVRTANAERFLSEREASVETVATLIGYSDDRAFRRAFKRWTGQTPSEFRANMR